MLQILKEIVEIEAIVDLPVLLSEFLFFVNSIFCFAWSVARLSLFTFFFFSFHF